MAALTDRQKRRLTMATAFTFVFMTGYALSMGMLGTLLPRIIEYYGLSVGMASTVNIANEIGNTSAMLFALFIVDRLDKHYSLGILGLLFGGSLFLFGVSPAFGLLLLIRVLIGFSGGLIDNVCATYISDLYGVRRARFVSILHTLFAIGNMAGPQFASACNDIGGWQLSFLISGGAVACSGLLFLLLTRLMGKPATAVSEEITESDIKGSRSIPYGTIIKRKNLWFLGISSMMLAGETYLTMALPTYLDYLDAAVFTTRSCAMIMTAYSFGMLLSRMGLAAFSGNASFKTSSYLKWASLLGGAVFVLLLLFGRSLMLWILGMLLFGAISGASYTARFVLSCQEFPFYSATASAFTGVFAALGNILFSAVVGFLADRGYYTLGMYLIAAALLIAFLIFVFLYKEPESPGQGN